MVRPKNLLAIGAGCVSGKGGYQTVSGVAEGLMISRWMPPQRVHRMVQYSAPARPGMMRRTESAALQSGQFESTGVACRVCSGRGREIRLAGAWPVVPPVALMDSRTAA
jgi:hypothetical protein